MATSPNQQAFRDFTKALNELVRLHNGDELMTYQDFESLAIDELNIFYDNVEGNRPYWQLRAEQVFSNAVVKLNKREDKQPYPEDTGDDNQNIFMFGLPLLPRDFKPDVSQVRQRNRVFTDLDDIREYLVGLPPNILRGIEPLYDKGIIYGFRIWFYEDT